MVSGLFDKTLKWKVFPTTRFGCQSLNQKLRSAWGKIFSVLNGQRKKPEISIDSTSATQYISDVSSSFGCTTVMNKSV